MPESFTARSSAIPGPRTTITLDVSETGLAELLAGISCTRVQLRDTGDGRYALTAVRPIGESRRASAPLVSDLLVSLLNRLGAALEADDVPAHLRELWDELLSDYNTRAARQNPSCPDPGSVDD